MVVVFDLWINYLLTTHSRSCFWGWCLALPQVLSPELVGRAHRFVNKLSLPKTGSTCTDLPYFDAPGTAWVTQ
jgi:hypothetical protein